MRDHDEAIFPFFNNACRHISGNPRGERAGLLGAVGVWARVLPFGRSGALPSGGQFCRVESGNPRGSFSRPHLLLRAPGADAAVSDQLPMRPQCQPVGRMLQAPSIPADVPQQAPLPSSYRRSRQSGARVSRCGFHPQAVHWRSDAMRVPWAGGVRRFQPCQVGGAAPPDHEQVNHRRRDHARWLPS